METLRWRDGCLEMIDPRVLPARFECVRWNTAVGVAQGIRAKMVRGAPAIECAAAYGVALAVLRLNNAAVGELSTVSLKAFDVLAESRPTVINLLWALKRMRAVWEIVQNHTVGEIVDRLLAEALEELLKIPASTKRRAFFVAALLHDGARFLTHCNTGTLETAAHGTALR